MLQKPKMKLPEALVMAFSLMLRMLMIMLAIVNHHDHQLFKELLSKTLE